MRRLVPTALIALVVLAFAALAQAASAPVSVPPLFKHVLGKARSRSGIAVRLPSRATFDVSRTTKLYATGGGSRGRYDLELAAARNCGGANACFVASFTGERAKHLGVRPNARLARGIRGRFQPLSCGASCSPPSITWVQRGVRYDLQARIDAHGTSQRAAFIALANSAITSRAR